MSQFFCWAASLGRRRPDLSSKLHTPPREVKSEPCYAIHGSSPVQVGTGGWLQAFCESSFTTTAHLYL